MANKPEEAVRKAVRGMLPKDPLGRPMLKKLKVYAGPDPSPRAPRARSPSTSQRARRANAS